MQFYVWRCPRYLQNLDETERERERGMKIERERETETQHGMIDAASIYSPNATSKTMSIHSLNNERSRSEIDG